MPLDTSVPNTVTGLQLLVISCVTATWGVLSIVDGWWLSRHAGLRLWRLPWSLGWFLVVSDGGLYLILGFGTLREPDPIPLWASLYFWVCFAWALAAYKHWASGKIEGGD